MLELLDLQRDIEGIVSGGQYNVSLKQVRDMTCTGLPAYSDTGYSDILATVTVFWSIKESPYTEIPS